MPPAQRIAWLTEKIERYPPRKVVPPAAVLHDERVEAAREAIHDELTERARIEERTEELIDKIEWPDRERLPKVATPLPRSHALAQGELEAADAGGGRKAAARCSRCSTRGKRHDPSTANAPAHLHLDHDHVPPLRGEASY